jgi:hypothetical protein
MKPHHLAQSVEGHMCTPQLEWIMKITGENTNSLPKPPLHTKTLDYKILYITVLYDFNLMARNLHLTIQANPTTGV